ncbi:MAG: formylglycine-generating enzyme family protein [Pseudomonadota bacterium]
MMQKGEDPAGQACCTPARGGGPVLQDQNAPGGKAVKDDGAVDIPGGTALVGTNAPQIPDDGEGPLRKVAVKPFRMAATAVTNAQFRAFVEATGFVTEAERFGWSFVFWSQVPKAVGPTQAVSEVQWWRRVDGATWFAPNGPETEEACSPDHPVVHVSWNDARAYADWVGGRLPTEAEWEHAARAGQGDVRFPWGDAEPNDTDFTPCNIWQGRFPAQNTAADGFVTTAPARSFEPNAFGLFNLAGNVWEWTADPYRVRSLKSTVKKRLAGMRGYKLSKGGSFLCHRSYCYRYRIAARSGTSPDSATTHHGLRVVWSL